MTSRSKRSCGTCGALPVSRVKTIMRSSPDVSSISPDAIALTAHSAELFISQLIKDAFSQTRKESKETKKCLQYKDLSQVVATNARMAFLQDVLPDKIKVKDYQLIVDQLEEQELESND